jgi:magnesium chelatase subunit D
MTQHDAGGLPAALAAALFAVDPVGLGGVALRSAAGPAREQWLANLAALLPAGTAWRRVPLHINDDRLLGGLDLSATLQAGRPIAQRGLLAEADGGIVLLAMAERLSAATAASVAAVLDTRELVAERHGIGTRSASRIGVVALDEGLADDEQIPSRLRERLAFHVTLAATPSANDELSFTRDDVAAARARFGAVRIDDAFVEGLCAASIALGIDSVRAPMLACRAARTSAALDARDAVNAQDAALAAALVLAPRATQLPAADADADADESPPSEPESAGATTDAPPPALHDDSATEPAPDTPAGPIDDVVLEAALAAIPPGLLALLALGNARSPRSPSAGRAGATQRGRSRGRPSGVRRGEPQGGARLNLIETLRAAAPWQGLRHKEVAGQARAARIQVRREDFHVWRFKQRSETTTLFVVDASGSSALNRLAEAKGAVELLLADCYVRRDSVAVIAFRGTAAELLLPPTRSLVRAKRSLAGLPGGGGTPLAAGIDAAIALADGVRRRGATPVVVLLTDGRANIARDGSPGRARAGADALAAARSMRVEGFAALLIDTSPQPQDSAREVAVAMGARYLPLPHAGAALLSQAVRAAGSAAPAPAR